MTEETEKHDSKRGLVINTPSRLHFGLIDLNGDYGRIDGGSGVSLTDPGWKLQFEPASDFSFSSDGCLDEGSTLLYDHCSFGRPQELLQLALRQGVQCRQRQHSQIGRVTTTLHGLELPGSATGCDDSQPPGAGFRV